MTRPHALSGAVNIPASLLKNNLCVGRGVKVSIAFWDVNCAGAFAYVVSAPAPTPPPQTNNVSPSFYCCGFLINSNNGMSVVVFIYGCVVYTLLSTNVEISLILVCVYCVA